MYFSPDTPLAVKRIQHQIWMSKTLEERMGISMQMIDDARKLQDLGLQRRFPNWDEQDIHLYRLKLWLQRDPKLFWLRPIVENLEKQQWIKKGQNLA